MHRFFAPALALVFAAAPAIAQDGKTYDLRTLMDRESEVGTQVRETSSSKTDTSQTILSNGAVVQERSNTVGSDSVRLRTVEKVDDEGQATELLYSYESFTDNSNGQEVDVSGLSVRFTKGAEDQWDYAVLDGASPPPAVVTALKSELKDKNSNDEDKTRNILLPEEKVAVGTPWAVSPEELAKMFGWKVEELNKEQCAGEGTITEVTTDDAGHEMVAVKINVTIAFSTFNGLPTPETMTAVLEAGIKMRVDGPTKGSTRFQLKIKGGVEPPNQPGAVVRIATEVDHKKSGEPIASKSE